MNKQIKEPDFIGGQGSLTKEEESELAKYFADKKSKTKKEVGVTHIPSKRETVTQE